MQKSPDQSNQHTPVLLEQVLLYLQPKPGETYLDLTAGYGGHAKAVLERTNYSPAVLIDRDEQAADFLQANFGAKNVEIMQQDFYSASQKLYERGQRFDMILADLGVSSPHLNMAERGFSFQKEGPLDMRMDRRQELTAEMVVNTYSEEELADLFRRYGGEPRAKKLAREIVRHRPVRTTAELAELVTQVWPPAGRRIHPATRAFQSLRIEVNDELDQLKKSLPVWINLLKPAGRLGIISFHSLEDRLVKEAFAEAGGNTYDAEIKILTKRPIAAGEDEKVFNPRARSAKLRAAVKIKI